MCCGYKYFAGSNFQQCMLTQTGQVIPDIDASNYHEVNMFMTQSVTPVCKSDDTITDSNGETCSSLYDDDSSACG